MKSVRSIVVKLYKDPEPQKLGVSLMALGESVYTSEDIEKVTHREEVYQNCLPIYAHYSNKQDKWVLSMEAPKGEFKVMNLEEASQFIVDNFDENFELNKHSKSVAAAGMLYSAPIGLLTLGFLGGLLTSDLR